MRLIYFTQKVTTHDLRFVRLLTEVGGHELIYVALGSIDTQHEYELRSYRGIIHIKSMNINKSIAPIGAQFTHWSQQDDLNAVFLLQSLIDKWKPDALQAGPLLDVTYIAACTKFQPLVAVSWGSDVLLDAWANEQNLKRMLRSLASAQALVCDNTNVVNKVKSLKCDTSLNSKESVYLNLDNSSQEDTLNSIANLEILCFPWGIDLDNFYKDSAAIHSPTPPSIASNDQIFTVVSTRRWEKAYDIPTTIKAFASSYKRNPKLRLKLVSDGSERDTIHKLIESYGITDVVELKGEVNPKILSEILKTSDLYISTTPSDGTSVSLLEALAAGLPLLACDNPSNQEWITNINLNNILYFDTENSFNSKTTITSRQNGLGQLCPAFDPDAFSKALLLLSQLPTDIHQHIQQHNRCVAKQRADWKKNSKQLLDLFSRWNSHANRPNKTPQPAQL